MPVTVFALVFRGHGRVGFSPTKRVVLFGYVFCKESTDNLASSFRRHTQRDVPIPLVLGLVRLRLPTPTATTLVLVEENGVIVVIGGGCVHHGTLVL